MSAASEEELQFLQELPIVIRDSMDVISNLLVVLLCFVLRKSALIKDEHLPGIAAMTFKVCLPALVLTVLWSANLRAELFQAIGWSALVSVAWILLVTLLVQLPIFPMAERGFMAMATSGVGIAYVIPVVLGSEKFSPDDVGFAAMFDVGGNMLVGICYYGVMNSIYASANPTALKDTKDEEAPATPPAGTIAMVSELPVRTTSEPPTAHRSEATEVTSTSRELLRRCQELSIRLFTNPLICALFGGVMLNLCQVPLYPVPVQALRALSGAFPPLLYAFLGATLKFKLGRKSYGMVGRALFFRLCLCLSMFSLIKYVLPLEDPMSSVLALTTVCPMASTFLMYAIQSGYAEEAAITYSLAAILSIVILKLLVTIV
eukprot:CAMPEP_0181508914 /NCGR_PEP_ID=MMETSP1110-20121109/60038_1 /TAXON_ID=174948 /ORGANISM="Symbiodinium sp., Strain CCMP421" /LENGTH=374 /DNA_ID=CAMNT_0023638383 /DNA_START=38 /DNA_END=1162 /DNA_ORIENTATION=-